MNNNYNVLDWLKLRVLSCYPEAVMLRDGEMPPPRMAIVYPTYLCNHRCYGCDYTKENISKKMYTEAEFINVVEQLCNLGVKAVEFCGGGEPTLNPHINKAIDRMVSMGMDFGLLTNGTNLNDDLCERLVRYGSYCRISVEASTEETFSHYKKPLNKNCVFKNVLYNIEKLVKARNEQSGKTKLQISYKYSIDMNNYQDVPNAVQVAFGLQVDSIQYKLIRNMETEIKDQEILDQLTKKLQKEKEKFPGFRVVFDFSNSVLKNRCWLSPLQVTIDPLGDVFICCYYRHRTEKHRLGNMFQNKLKDIWYSHTHWEKIGQINKEDCNKYDCRFHYYNELMEELIIKDKGQLHFI